MPLCRISLFQGDITHQEVDVIVSAANAALAGGGGVDGAIHRAAGPSLMRELRQKYHGCPTGSAVITGAGHLKAKFVIHAVGPIWRGGNQNEAALLASAYRTCLELAQANGCKTIAFPSISTGVYRYPVALAANVALRTVLQYCKENPNTFAEIRFVLFDRQTYQTYKNVLIKLA